MRLRPATVFPPTPEPKVLETTYQECRAALVSANRARGARKALSGRRGVVITEPQRQLVEMVRRLAHQAKRWRRVNARAATLTAEAAEVAGAAGQLGGNA